MSYLSIPNGSQVSAAAAEWLEPIPWQLFCTLEFPYKARPELAVKKFDSMVNNLERSLRTRVCYVNASETRSKSGAVVPLHFHTLLTSARPISTQLVTGMWNEGVGRTNSVGGDLAQVESFDPSMGGVS